MAEGIYSPNGVNNIYARNRFGRKLLKSLPINSIHTAGDPEGEFSVPVNVNGTVTLISAIEGKQIEVIGYSLVASGASVVSLRSSNNNIFGPISLAANGQVGNSNISIKTNVQEPLILVSTSQVGGFINYRIV